MELSVCKEDVKILKYIGDLKEELNINKAMSFVESGVDVFDATDEFFNNICHEYDNKDGIDIIIDDRRNDIYKNVSFCEQGCTYNGMNYELMIANCICDTSILESSIENNNKENIGSEKQGFNSISKSIIASLIDFNYDVIKCNNLVFNLKFLKNNIGFYFMLILFFLQLICLFVYIAKKLKSLKNFMLNFKDKNLKDSKALSLNKNNNNNSITNSLDNIKEKNLKDNSVKNKSNINKNKLKNKKREKRKNNKLFMKEDEINSKRKLDVTNEDKGLENIFKKNSLNIEIPKEESKVINNNENKKKSLKEKKLIFSQIVNIQSPILNIFPNTPNNVLGKKKEKSKKEKKAKCIILENENETNNDKKAHNPIELKKNKKTRHKKDRLNSIKNNKIRKKEINKLETIEEKNDEKNNKEKISLYKTDEDIQDMDYEEAIIYDKRSFLLFKLNKYIYLKFKIKD